MLVVSIFETTAGQQFRVSEVTGDGTTTDVTDGYEVHALEVQHGEDLVTGWHIGKRTPLVPELNGGCLRP